MKNLVIIIALMLILFFACDDQSATEEIVPEPTVIETETFNSVKDLRFYGIGSESEDGDIVLEANSFLEMGEEITHLNSYIEAKDSANGSPRTYALIRNEDGKEGYALSNYIYPNGRLGVTRQETVIYTDNKLTAASGQTVNRLMLFVYDPDESDETFLKISGHHELDDKWVREQFIKRADASLNETDITAAILYITAETRSNEVSKREILENALQLQNAIFYEEIKAALDELDGSPGIASEPVNAPAVTSKDEVLLYAEPDGSSTVIATLENGHALQVLMRTKEISEMDGIQAAWLLVESSEFGQGWVFGSNIDFTGGN